MKIFPLLLALFLALLLRAQEAVPGTARVDRLRHASVNDTISIYTTLSFSGPAASVSARLLDPGCRLLARGNLYRLAVRDTGVFRVLFTGTGPGAAKAETVFVTVTDQEPVLSLSRHLVEAAVNEPFRLGLSVKDDGGGVRIYVDFDSDGRVDTACDAEPEPAFFFSKPTLSGEKDRYFNMRLKAVDNDGRKAYDSLELAVQFKPPRADAGSNTIVCLEEPYAFSGRASKDFGGAVKAYRWDFDLDGRPDTVLRSSEVEWAFGKVNDFQVALTVQDNDGNLSLPDTIVVSVMRDKPAALAVTPVTGRAGARVEFTGRGSSQCSEIEKYYWDFQGDGKWDFTSRNQGKASFTFREAGDYVARFMVKNARGDSASQNCVVRIDP